jgi:hypothetical protein
MQDPSNLERFNMSKFHHLKLNLTVRFNRALWECVSALCDLCCSEEEAISVACCCYGKHAHGR